MSKIINVGRVTSYADAVAGGYTGTREQWEHDLANLGTVAAEVEADRAEVAENTATVAEDKAAVEEDKSAAESAAGSAAESAASAHTDAIAATAAKEAAQTAQGLAENAASTAANAKDAAQTAQTAAEAAQTAAEAAQTAAETAQAAAETAETNAETAQTGAEAAQAAAEAVLESIPEDYSAMSADVTDLKSAIGDISEDIDYVMVTPGISKTEYGVTIKTDGDELIIYGTSTDTRRICFLNGNNAIKTTTSAFEETLKAGTYICVFQQTGPELRGSIAVGYTTFGEGFILINTTDDQPRIIKHTFRNDFMLGYVMVGDRNFGTSENPTRITFHAYKQTAYDDVARDSIDTLNNAAILKTENLLYFDNQRTRSYDNQITVSFPNESTIKFNAPVATTRVYQFTVSKSNKLKAGKTYIFRRKIIENNTINVWYFRIDSSGTETRVYNGEIFTPQTDEYIQIRFLKGFVNVGTIMLYAAEFYDAKSEADIAPYSVDEGPIICGNIKINKYIALNGSTANISNFVDSDNYCVAIIPCQAYDRFRLLAFGQSTPRTWGFIDANGTILSVAGENTDTTTHIALEPITITAPENTAYLVVNHCFTLTGYYPKIVKLSKSDILNRIAEENGTIPQKTNPSWKTKVVAALNSMIVIKEDNTLKFSDNCGLTFDKSVDVSSITGVIHKYHLYNNGCLGLFTHNAAYYIETGWEGYNSASVYEADGVTPYTPAALENYYTIFDYAQRKIVDGQDWYVFGNYVVNGGNNTRKVIWCSTDNGHSYKIIYEFNLQSTYAARHVHSVYYYAAEDLYIVTTGDTAAQCHILALKYDDNNDEWNMTYIAGGTTDYKWAGLEMWGDTIYYSYDMTPGSIRTCKYADIDDLTKHETILDNTPNDAVGILIGPKGDMIITLSWWRTGTTNSPLPQEFDCRLIYYSPDRKNFYPIYTDPHILNGYSAYSTTMPITTDGHAIMGVHKSGTSNWDKTPSVYLDEIVRKSGFPNAFKPL